MIAFNSSRWLWINPTCSWICRFHVSCGSIMWRIFWPVFCEIIKMQLTISTHVHHQLLSVKARATQVIPGTLQTLSTIKSISYLSYDFKDFQHNPHILSECCNWADWGQLRDFNSLEAFTMFAGTRRPENFELLQMKSCYWRSEGFKLLWAEPDLWI